MYMMAPCIHGLFILFEFILLRTEYCFNAQVQDAYLIIVDEKEVVQALVIDTINDTTAVKQRFHVDYFHPKSKIWTSYQEDRRTMVCFINCSYPID